MSVLWKPQPKQAIALSCPATELFYGGAAGGGKSDFLLMDCFAGVVKYARTYRAIIFRQTTVQLGELLRRANELYLPMGAQFKQKNALGNNIYFFPNGATIQFAYLKSDRDVEIYQGQQFSYVGFDELGNYPSPYAWDYMQSRLRSAAGNKSYIRGTGNPGGRGQGWIKQRFMNGKEPNKIYKTAVKLADGSERVYSSCFIPSTLYDNKILMQNDPDYEAKMMMLPPHQRRALLEGNWDIFAGNVFSIFNRQTHVKPHFILDSRYWFKFCSMDWGFSRPYDLQFWAVNAEGRMYMYREIYGCKEGEYNVGVKEGSDNLAKRAFEIASTEGVSCCVADPAIWNKADDAPSIAEVFEKYGWQMIKGNNDRKNGLILFYQMLENTDHNGIPMLTVAPECEGFIRTIPALTPNPNCQEDIDTSLEDHPYDAARYAVMSDIAQHPTRYIVSDSYRHEATRTSWDPLA